MDLLAVLGLVVLVLVKEAGVPLPVPGDLVIIGAGASLAGDLPGAGSALAAILVAGFIGASIQFLLFRSALRRPLLSVLGRLGVGESRLAGLSDRFRRGGAAAVAVARMTPGVRIAVIPAAAIATLPFAVFLPGIVAGNGAFVTAHFGLGFLFGAYARAAIDQYGSYVVLVIAALAVLAVVGWLIVRAIRRRSGAADTYECWTDCSCPACVVLLAGQRPADVAP
ncbi:MAG TPA: VTT domain-containing protein [Candidatus Limnocylindria bacterium]|nr:VTT domain-containing protein [Candidatus Limnocylindria bacterium]